MLLKGSPSVAFVGYELFSSFGSPSPESRSVLFLVGGWMTHDVALQAKVPSLPFSDNFIADLTRCFVEVE